MRLSDKAGGRALVVIALSTAVAVFFTGTMRHSRKGDAGKGFDTQLQGLNKRR